jgi:hypothetical protein
VPLEGVDLPREAEVGERRHGREHEDRASQGWPLRSNQGCQIVYFGNQTSQFG